MGSICSRRPTEITKSKCLSGKGRCSASALEKFISGGRSFWSFRSTPYSSYLAGSSRNCSTSLPLAQPTSSTRSRPFSGRSTLLRPLIMRRRFILVATLAFHQAYHLVLPMIIRPISFFRVMAIIVGFSADVKATPSSGDRGGLSAVRNL